MKFDRRTALKSVLAGLSCFIPQLARPAVQEPLTIAPYQDIDVLLAIDGGSLRESYFYFHTQPLIDALCDRERADGTIYVMHIEWDNGHIDYEDWMLIQGVWYRPNTHHVPEQYWDYVRSYRHDVGRRVVARMNAMNRSGELQRNLRKRMRNG